MRGSAVKLCALLALVGLALTAAPAGATPVVCPTPIVTGPLSFCAVSGMSGTSVSFSIASNVTPSLTVGLNFTLVCSNGSCTLTFTPLAAACGTVTDTLTLSIGACPIIEIPLIGVATSFSCLIGAAQSATCLSPSGKSCILSSLLSAAGTTNRSAICGFLFCALCCAQAEVAAGRSCALTIVQQIQCLNSILGCSSTGTATVEGF